MADTKDGIGEAWIHNPAMTRKVLPTVAGIRRYIDLHVSNLWLANDNLRSWGVLGSPLTAYRSQKFSAFDLIFPAEILEIHDGDDDEILDDEESYLWKNSSHRFAAVMVRGGSGDGDGDGNVVFLRHPRVLMEKAGCFFPAEILDRDDAEKETHLLTNSSRRFAAVMGGGGGGGLSSDDELGVVEKVGCFIGTPKLRQLLRQNPHYVTFLDKVVIT